MFGHMKAVQEVAFEAIRPGARCSDVDMAVRTYFAQHDLFAALAPPHGTCDRPPLPRGPVPRLGRPDGDPARDGVHGRARPVRARARRLPPLGHRARDRGRDRDPHVLPARPREPDHSREHKVGADFSVPFRPPDEVRLKPDPRRAIRFGGATQGGDMSAAVTTELKTIGHWIGGESVRGSSGRQGPVYNPATGEQTRRGRLRERRGDRPRGRERRRTRSPSGARGRSRSAPSSSSGSTTSSTSIARISRSCSPPSTARCSRTRSARCSAGSR